MKKFELRSSKSSEETPRNLRRLKRNNSVAIPTQKSLTKRATKIEENPSESNSCRNSNESTLPRSILDFNELGSMICSVCNHEYDTFKTYLNVSCLHSYCLRCLEKNPYFGYGRNGSSYQIPCIVGSCKGEINTIEIKEFVVSYEKDNNSNLEVLLESEANCGTSQSSIDLELSGRSSKNKNLVIPSPDTVIGKFKTNVEAKKKKKAIVIERLGKLKCSICFKSFEDSRAFLNQDCKHTYCFLCLKKSVATTGSRCLMKGCKEMIDKTALCVKVDNNFKKAKWNKIKMQCEVCKSDKANLMLDDNRRSCEECFYSILKAEMRTHLQYNAESTTEELKKCLICDENEREVTFYKCGHTVCCSKCSEKFKNGTCPICRVKIVDTVRIYF